MKAKDCKIGTKVFVYSGFGRWRGVITQSDGHDCFLVETDKEGMAVAHCYQLRKRVKKKSWDFPVRKNRKGMRK